MSKKKKIDVDPNLLYELYVIKEYSQRQVGKELGISQTQVRRELEKVGITPRHGKDAYDCKGSKLRREELSERYKKEYTIWRENTCQYCGKTFLVDGEHKKRKYCSKACIDLARKENRRKQYCKNCGKEINVRYKRVYCDECMYIWRTLLPSKKIKTNCGYCGKEIEVIPSIYNSNKFCYCDKECMSKHYAEIYTGENSPTWKGGKSHHYVGGFYAARKKVRERDEYTCQLCGITEKEYGMELSVHHITKYRLFEDKQEANNLDNLVCLCEKCHRFVHSNANVDNIYIKSLDNK